MSAITLSSSQSRLLKENPTLLQLYRDLVITKVITSEEFWAQHASQYTQANQAPNQEIGVNSAFLVSYTNIFLKKCTANINSHFFMQADVKPQTDGCNGLRYNVTKDIIECIFKTYPAVKRKHQEYVPSKLSDSDFWIKFFQSHYVHRDRIHAGTKDLFTECAKIDEQELKKDIQAGIDDPIVDITNFDDVQMSEIYDNGINKSDKASGNIVHQNMIKRFNQHSIMIMKVNINQQPAKDKQPQTNGTALPNKNSLDQSKLGSPKSKKVSNLKLEKNTDCKSTSDDLNIKITKNFFLFYSDEYKKN